MRLGLGLGLGLRHGTGVDENATLISSLSDVNGIYIATSGGVQHSSVVTSGGVITEWWDYRGETGFGPKLVGTGAARPAWDGTALAAAFDGVDDLLITALSALYAIDGAKSMWVVCDHPGTGGAVTAQSSAWIGDFTNGMGIVRHGTGDGAGVLEEGGGRHYPGNVLGGSDVGNTGAAQPSITVRRVVFVGKNGTTGARTQVYGSTAVAYTITAPAAGNREYAMSKFSFAGKIKAAGVLGHDFTAGDVSTIGSWAVTHMGALSTT